MPKKTKDGIEISGAASNYARKSFETASNMAAALTKGKTAIASRKPRPTRSAAQCGKSFELILGRGKKPMKELGPIFDRLFEICKKNKWQYHVIIGLPDRTTCQI